MTLSPDLRFSGKVAVVTGGGSGMGEAICLRLAGEGACVGVLDVDAENGRRVADAIITAGGAAMFVAADVTNDAAMHGAVAAVGDRWGRLDIAVNNAGVPGARHLLTELPLDVWHRTLAINLTGVFLSLRAEIAVMAATGGSIINMASITGVVAHPLAAAYVATKHAVIGLTKSAALEWGHAGIRINAVAPTWVRTPMTEAVFDAARWAELDAKHATGRVATMADVAALVAFLASDEAAMITGSVQMIDGGYTAA